MHSDRYGFNFILLHVCGHSVFPESLASLSNVRWLELSELKFGSLVVFPLLCLLLPSYHAVFIALASFLFSGLWLFVSFMLLYEFYDIFCLCEEFHENFNKGFIESVNCF